MLSLPTFLPSIKKSGLITPAIKNSVSAPRSPVMRQRAGGSSHPAAGTTMQAAHFYFDASWQTGKTFRALLEPTKIPKHDACDKGLNKSDASAKFTVMIRPAAEPLGRKPAEEMLTTLVDKLLWSLRPGLTDDEESKTVFLQLLDRQLSGMDAETLGQLKQALQQAKYHCFLTEAVIDDKMYLEYGFANGAPHSRERTLLTTPDLYDRLDMARQAALAESAAQSAAPPLLTPSQAQAARNQLALNASLWKSSDKSLLTLDALMQSLATTVDIKLDTPLAIAAQTISPSSSIGWEADQLLIDSEVAAHLQHEASDDLFARVQRDVLEILLARKSTNAPTDIDKVSLQQRLQLWQAIDQVETLAPTIVIADERRQQLRQCMDAIIKPGQIQIMPSVGAALGHAWIAPHLSVMPDKYAAGKKLGDKYTHGGAQLEPRHSTINELPIRWLNHLEMEDVYPSHKAWHLPVPVEADQLDQTVTALIHDWKASGQTYRFAEVSPDKPASGCRISVWESVRRSLSPTLRECFDEFNLGVPLPDTPTELWVRMRDFRRWMEALVKQ